MMTKEEIGCCRKIGRYEQARSSMIGLTELDALCDTAELAVDLLEGCKVANACLDNLSKAVPWGKTFDLDVAALNKALYVLPRLIARAEKPKP